MEASDVARVRNAAVDCLVDELLAILNSPVIEVGGRAVVIFKADLIAETKRRIETYSSAAKSGS